MGGNGSFRVDLHKERRNNYGHPRFIADYYYEAQIHIQIYNILKIGHYTTFLVRTISITNKNTFLLILRYDLRSLRGRVTHICVNNLNIIGSDDGLLPSSDNGWSPSNEPILEYH